MNNRLILSDLPLSGLKLVERRRLSDTRGYLSRIFCSEELAAANWSKPIAQINHTFTKKCGTVRGLHFQRVPDAEMKLVSCIRGSIWDVAVDIRAGSSTFLQWHAECLSSENCRAMLIPEGFAHGFQSLTDEAELLYCHSAGHVATAEAGLNAMDPMLKIQWPLEITELSVRDAQHQLLDMGYHGMAI